MNFRQWGKMLRKFLIFMKTINLKKIKSVHFIGIGGIGVSAIARMMLLNNKKVSGSDSAPSPVTDRIKRLGARIYISHQNSNISLLKHANTEGHFLIFHPRFLLLPISITTILITMAIFKIFKKHSTR